MPTIGIAAEGVTDFDRYRVDPSQPLAPDFFVPDDATADAARLGAADVVPLS